MALFYEKGGHLYGRYWGCFQEIPFLHFATCYYHPIAYAIEKGLAVMDPGFGGEHKLIRGYEVVPIYHYIKFHGKKEHDIAEAIMKKLRAHYALPFERV
jgi:predicted N-acyltransferase